MIEDMGVVDEMVLWKWGIAMKIGMKEDMGLADEMTLSNSVSHTCRARNCAWRGLKHSYSQFFGRIEMKITWRRTWALSMKWHNAQKMTVASYGAHKFTSFRQKVVARIIRFGQKSAWRRTWLLPTKWYRQVLDHAHAARYIRCTSTVYGGQK